MANLVENKKAGFNYELLEHFEAGIVLAGGEVKSLKLGHGKLEGAHVVIRGGEAYLVGAEIPAYQPGNTPANYDPARSRRLLLTKAEINQLADQGDRPGLTIVPISIYNKGRYIKLKLAIGRGKKKFDKRQSIKRRDVEREIGRTLKR